MVPYQRWLDHPMVRWIQQEVATLSGHSDVIHTVTPCEATHQKHEQCNKCSP